ncbi:TNT domain-containing protein [Amycolatopsis pigmentata]|uniref:TNT domain-containing protein n=1 Tax=Amycolatopsis pigmentata TaxID=450801 RepID=A0ABW5FUT8_9PSEU
MSAPQEEQARLLLQIGKLAAREAPEGWTRIEVRFRRLGKHTELEPVAFTAKAARPFDGSGELSAALSELRTLMYEPGRGTWLWILYTLQREGDIDFDVGSDPWWDTPPFDLPAMVEAEQNAFPREADHLPDWWRRAAGLPLAVTFRQARVVKGAPPVPDAEIPLLLRYLERQPEVLISSGLGPDAFTGGTEVDVPQGYHTDGAWIWPTAVAHYLRKYAIPPEPEFLAHIRERGYHAPYADKLVRLTAAADLLGRPRPKADPREVTPTSGDIAAELETTTDPRLEDAAVLVVLAQRLDEHGVRPDSYRIASRADGAWCLNTRERGWEVARYADGKPVSPRYFASAEDAAQQLLGALLLHPARMTGNGETSPETVAEVADWPIQPVEGEPPLTLFRNKRMVRLAAGTVVLRFGDDQGNLVHHDETRFPATSLPIERERRERRYRIRRTLIVLLGVAVPWAGMPGGAIGYVLPKTLRDHVADGSLEKA